MKKQLHLIFCTLLCFIFYSPLHSQTCPGPAMGDFSYCYGSGEIDLVIFEVCDAAIVDIIICQGDWEAGFDDLTIYEGAAGSGTTGTIVAGPLDGDLTGTTASTTTAGNCLIFVSNSDGSVSCVSGSRPSLEVYLGLACPPPPTYDASYCYDSGEIDVVAFELCCAADEIVDAIICQGDFELNFDELTIYEGAAGSGTTGTIVAGPLDGDLTGVNASTTTAGNCLIFVSNSDGSISCASGSRPELLVNFMCSAALPVELAKFSGTKDGESNILDWQTASEINTEMFAIERSFDGKVWTKIGEVPAKGFSNVTERYAFTDTKPLPKSLYRLNIIDFNGYQEYSEIVTLERSIEADFQVISIYPNPASDVLNVNYFATSTKTINWSLMDVNGKVIYRSNTVAQGEVTIEIPVHSINTGIYLLTINSDTERIIERIVIE